MESRTVTRLDFGTSFDQGVNKFVLASIIASTALFVVVVIYTKYTQYSSAKTPYLNRTMQASLSPKTVTARVPGSWEPSLFTIPTPPPYPDWSIETTKPVPYRPFRYGPNYFVTMGLRQLKFDDWIELDNHFPQFYRTKRRRIQERGHRCCTTTPEAYLAAVELLEELASYLPARYPTLYERTERGIKNLWSGEEVDTTSDPLPEDPMQSCGRLIQDDMAVMMEKSDGKYYLQAGSILLAGFWRLEDKLGMRLADIHTSGHVPQYKEKLEKGMDNFFRRLKPGELIGRNNYVMQVDDDLAWTSNSVGPEDDGNRGWHWAEKNRIIEHHHLRTERQTLHRLPKSGGIVFTIRTYLLPVTEIAQEDHVPGRLASAARSWPEDVSRYKGGSTYKDVLLEYLDKEHQRQVERGVAWEEADAKSSYPF